ncbi:glycosyltransferase [Alkalihalobacillus sp. BA299]|uniref:glycosyltransferase n=1 Tax=Alkalihalobacillus sp. BA299 TaxID=2815938 RepID=UPI001AD9D576|nr:glycosyltransferase [Alkalihalobacillus sp. BA299]
METYRPLIYADIDLNIIDGSAIWVTSIVETLAQGKNVHPTLLLKRPIINDKLIKNLQAYDNVTILDPWGEDFKKLKLSIKEQRWKIAQRLEVKYAGEIISNLDKKLNYDFFIVRGFELSKEIAYNHLYSNRTWFYITDFPQKQEEVTETHLSDLISIYKNSNKLACQTPDLINYFKELLDVKEDSKFLYLPPMIPNLKIEMDLLENKHNKLVYVGKFGPYWKAPEMFQAFSEIGNENYSFVVAGDKFHNYPFEEGYDQKVTAYLENTKNVIWKKGLSRGQVQDLINECDVGVSWRDEALDDSKELSTKVLEYGLHGKPVILNRNYLHEKLFGEDYPLYANSKQEFMEKVNLAFTDAEAYRKAAEKILRISEKHTFSNIFGYLKPLIEETKHIKKYLKENEKNKIRLLIAGHDLKFAKLIINYFSLHPDYDVRLDKWTGHNQHDQYESNKLLKWADVILCEWGLGNAVWYSKKKLKRQKMLIRMHNQEKNTPYPQKIVWKNVNKLVFISNIPKSEIMPSLNLPDSKIELIYNVVDAKILNKSKLPGYEFNLGFMGVSPKLKRLEMALEIFEQLWLKDPRYTLYVKGKLPNEYGWLWNRTEERNYYLNIFKKLNQSPWANSVVFDGWGSDVSEWFKKIGFVLSTSDSESFHLAVAEGMASGAIPVIRNWYGSEDLYPNEYIFTNVDEAVSIVKDAQELNERKQTETELKEFIRNNYDKEIICNQWDVLIRQLMEN